MDHQGQLSGQCSSPAEATDLKTRIFAAFEHACRYGEVEVADQLLAIINSKWIKPSRMQLNGMPGAQRHGAAARTAGH
jgi:hypothetical protein